MNIGSNSAAALRGHVEAIVELHGQLIDIHEIRKGKVAEMKKLQLPVPELVRVAKQDLDKTAEKAKNLQDAAGILGVEVYASITKPSKPKEFDDSVIESAEASVRELLALDQQAKDLKADIKERLKLAKVEGWAPKIIVQVVELKMNKNGFAAYTEQSALVEQYWQAVAA